MIKNSFNLKQLEAFVAVIDAGTYRRAAERLGTTQPNISARINALESQLGVVLMHRDAGSVRLTERGALLLQSAREVLWSAEKFVETANRKDLVQERLRLGVTELIACTWLHDFLRALKQIYPAVAVELSINLSKEIEAELNSNQIDLALQTAPFDKEMTGTIALDKQPYGWVAAPELVAEIGDARTLRAFVQWPILAHAKHTIAAKRLAETVETNGLPPERIVHSSSLTSSMQMAVDGMGIAMLPKALTGDLVTTGKLVALDCDWHPPALEFFARFDAKRMPRFIAEAAALAAKVSRETER